MPNNKQLSDRKTPQNTDKALGHVEKIERAKIGTRWNISDHNSNLEINDNKTDKHSISIDGGYGWVIVAVSFYCNFVVDGICYAFGNLRPLLQEKFVGNSEATIAFIGSSLLGAYLLVGPIVSAFINKYGPRIVVAIGGIITSLAFLCSIFITNIYCLIFVFGILGGAGLGFLYLPATVVVCFFFKKKRSLATGFAVAGSGAGNIVMPQIIAQLHSSGFTVNCIVLTAFAASCIFVGMLYIVPDEFWDADKEKNLAQSTFSKTDVLENSIDALNLQRPYSSTTIEDLTRTKLEDEVNLRLVPDNDIPSQGIVETLVESKSNVLSRLGEKLQEAVVTVESQIKSVQVSGGTSTDGSKVRMIDAYLKLMKEPVEILMVLTNLLAMTGFYVPFVFPADLAVSKGVSYDDAKLLVSIIGIFNTTGRLLFGWLADRKWISALTLHNTSLIGAGILTILCPFCSNYTMFLIYSVLFGLLGVLAEWLGLDEISIAFGLLILGRSFGCFFGTPIAGAIKDATESFVYPFYLSGTFLITGGLAGSLIPVLSKPKGSQKESQNFNNEV
ncbi:unnamed protein product [Enterobius vermicularis]|uniref:MFS domain-containing protein n=1 Tax=Enterobius vermicularis TaxID=51028 RepID=A0A158QB88_ENTVE|nr:unnamed protein product [Enterobius vermicularis]